MQQTLIEWLNANLDAGDAIIYSLIGLVVWFVIWHLIISRLFGKYEFIGDLMDYGPILAPIASFGMLLFLSVFVVLFISSIQATLSYGAKMIFALSLFWSGVIAFFVLLIRRIRK